MDICENLNIYKVCGFSPDVGVCGFLKFEETPGFWVVMFFGYESQIWTCQISFSFLPFPRNYSSLKKYTAELL